MPARLETVVVTSKLHRGGLGQSRKRCSAVLGCGDVGSLRDLARPSRRLIAAPLSRAILCITGYANTVLAIPGSGMSARTRFAGEAI
jgi:hypothetical protein